MALSSAQTITLLFVGYFGRAPDAAGLTYWSAALDAGQSLTSIAAVFARSPEAQALYPYLINTATSDLSFFIGGVYHNLANRDPDIAGYAYWIALLQSGNITPGQFILSFEDSISRSADAIDYATLTNKTQVALDFETKLAAAGIVGTLQQQKDALKNVSYTGASVNGGESFIQNIISPPSGSSTPTSGSFTTGTDTITGYGSDIIAATLGTGATLTANDKLTGSGSNKLAITDTSASTVQLLLPSGLVISGVSTVTLNTSASAGATTVSLFDVSGFTGLTSLTTTTAGTSSDYIATGSGVAVTANYNGTGAGVLVSGAFSTFNMISTTATQMGTKNATGAVTLTDATGSTPLTFILINSTLTSFTDASNHLSTLNFAASGGANTVKAISGTAITSVSLTNFVTLGTDSTHLLAFGANVSTVSGAADNSANYISVSKNTAAVTLGNGANTVKDASASGGVTFTLGTGNNTVDLGSHGNGKVTIGVDVAFNAGALAANVIIQNVAVGDKIAFTGIAAPHVFNEGFNSLTTFAFLANHFGLPDVVFASGSIGGNTYIMTSHSGTLSATDSYIVELIGVHTIAPAGGFVILAS